MRPFRFGIVGRASTRAEWQDFAREAEDLGFSTLLVPDHFTAQFAPLPSLVSAAAVTTRLRFGTNVLCNDFRHPAVLAKEVASVDVLTDGRMELGIGAGWSPSDYSQTGPSFDPGPVRFKRLQEAVHIIARALTEESVTFTGEYYQVTDLRVLPRPLQQPHPPLLIAASRPRMLAFAAEHGDIVGLEDQQWPQRDLQSATIPVADAAAQVAAVRAAAGERFAQLEMSMLLARIVVTDHEAAAVDDLARQLELTPAQVRDSASILIGSVDHIVELLQERRERLGISYCVVSRFATIDGFAPIVARLAGT